MALRKIARNYGVPYKEFIATHNAMELAEELAFEQLCPSPDISRWFARIMATLYNAHGDGKRQWTADDFLPGQKVIRRREQSAEEQQTILSAIARCRG